MEYRVEGFQPDLMRSRAPGHIIAGTMQKRRPVPASPFDSPEVQAQRRKNEWEIPSIQGGAENLYYMGNGYSALSGLETSNATAETTGTAGTASVLLQVGTPATRQISIVEYGISMSGSPAGASLMLRSCATGGSTVVAGIITPYSNPNAPTALCTSGTTTSGYTTAATAPPSNAATGVYDQQLLTTNTYVKQFPLAREPVFAVSNWLMLVINVPTTAVTALCYIIWRE